MELSTVLVIKLLDSTFPENIMPRRNYSRNMKMVYICWISAFYKSSYFYGASSPFTLLVSTSFVSINTISSHFFKQILLKASRNIPDPFPFSSTLLSFIVYSIFLISSWGSLQSCVFSPMISIVLFFEAVLHIMNVPC